MATAKSFGHAVLLGFHGCLLYFMSVSPVHANAEQMARQCLNDFEMFQIYYDRRDDQHRELRTEERQILTRHERMQRDGERLLAEIEALIPCVNRDRACRAQYDEKIEMAERHQSREQALRNEAINLRSRIQEFNNAGGALQERREKAIDACQRPVMFYVLSADVWRKVCRDYHIRPDFFEARIGLPFPCE
ncbi:hypothetical protein FM042_09330 [Aliidiomarina halalkaliphila]|uniref:Uncharacterized protein n=1 Tax=Aliidiomarina halalkaliphila TaxID=2593535 RepID=A0A552WZX4_9GAMM|nr:hypothetical protein [Aliidiomarina halalkaliphila]TRW48370.1 hypothetical protein FM042_09330 [Aliidiomarina halalkaliphila]